MLTNTKQIVKMEKLNIITIMVILFKMLQGVDKFVNDHVVSYLNILG